jgi:predicted membrane-bound spermidine synthase
MIQLAHSLCLVLSVDTANTVALYSFFGVTLAMILLVGMLSGIELPLLIRLGNDASGDGKITNRVLGWDYIGALAGGLLFPLALVPFLDLAVIGFGTALLNVSVGAYVLYRFVPRQRWFRRKTGFALVLGVMLVFGITQSGHVQQYFLKRYYYAHEAAESGSLFGPLSELPEIVRAYSPYQKIDLVTDTSGYEGKVLIDAYSSKFALDPSHPRGWYLFLNGDFQVSSDYEEIYHEWFAHIPIILAGKAPERVLVMGGGDGLLLRELVKHESIGSIRHVDLDRTLVGLAKTHSTFTSMNQRVFDDPRIQTEFGDAYQVIRKSQEVYDAIYLDFPNVMDYNLSKLYSREFFHFVRAHLAEGGYAVLDVPGANLRLDPDLEGNLQLQPGGTNEVYFNTIRSAGFRSIVPFHTRLEMANERAIELLEASSLMPTYETASEEGLRQALRREWIRQFIGRHTTNLTQNFILMWKDDRDPTTHPYLDLDIDLRVLNEGRFGLAFPPPLSRTAEIDPFKVNSILRPTLPNRSLLSVRKPW